MINTHFGITHTPFSQDEQPLLQAQKDIPKNYACTATRAACA